MLTWRLLGPAGQGRDGWKQRLLHAWEKKREKNIQD